MAFRRGATQPFVSTCFLWLWLGVPLAFAQTPSASLAEPLFVHADFPGGNILVEEIKGDAVWLRQDLRNASQSWFYWMFSVKGAQSRTIDFHFTGGDVFGMRGPAASCDGGRNWFWLGAEACRGRSFRYAFGPHEETIQFGAVIPYVERDLDLFLARYETNNALKIGTLGHTPKGRPVEWLRAGRVDGQAPYRMLVTCRHYASETMASFAVEGLLTEVLGTNEAGLWFRENVEVCLVPFVDKDGVETGEQGRWRYPYEFWLDYGSESRYTAARSLRARFDPTNGPAVQLALDLQCPSLRDDALRLASSANLHPGLGTNVARFSELLEQRQQGPLVYRRAQNHLIAPHANRTNEFGVLSSFLQWAETLPGSEVVAVVELPFASVGSAEVNADSARAFGQDLATAARAYFGGRIDPTLTGRARPARLYRRPANPEAARRPQTNAPAIQAPEPAPKRATNAIPNT